ncbi:MAG: imelysin family protein [Rhodoferax sp.]|uniref:imelysin family protein n=1 Tax=Rhodoferax sp. TaxID=50421 RepID=UPI003262F14D
MLRTLLLWTALGCTAPAWAAPADQPFDAYARFVRGVYAQWYLPGADDFAAQSQALAGPLQQLCAADAATEAEALARAQQQWLRTVAAWERFSAVRGGALLARRSPRSLDFMPTRPEAIAEAVRTVSPGATTLEAIGAPAKGLPALEWLLWPGKLRPHTPTCHYAEQLGTDILAEAQALQSAYAAALQAGWDDQEAEYAMYEFLNLWNGALQKLWREDIDRTLQKLNAGRLASFNRSASGHAAQAWAIHWQALRSLAVGSSATDSTSLHAYLLAQNHAAQAALLQQAVTEVDHAMDRLLASRDPTAASGPLRQLIVALKDLQHFSEKDMGPALHFTVSFFDEDGD